MAKLLHPLSTAIRYSEGDGVPLSAIPRIRAHIDNLSSNENLQEEGWNDEEIQTITEKITGRK